MRKILAIPALALFLTLGGCAQLGEKILHLPAGALTASVNNPVTKKRSAQVQQGFRVAVATLRAHKRLCERAVLPPSCVDDVNHLQGYVSRARPFIADLRKFVKQNDQVNAQVAFNTVVQIMDSLKQDAGARGVVLVEK